MVKPVEFVAMTKWLWVRFDNKVAGKAAPSWLNFRLSCGLADSYQLNFAVLAALPPINP